MFIKSICLKCPERSVTAFCWQDLGGNLVHTFTINPLQQINTTSPSISGAGPRHGVIDSTANFLYVIDEEGLRVDQFKLDASTGALALTDMSLAITPFGGLCLFPINVR